jgi:peptidoglycan/xylan/chitin deacetylase (PgdA/CDA1 family)
MMNTRYVVSNMLEYAGVNAAALAARCDSLTVLCYHRVLDAGDPIRARGHPALFTSTHVFERQMELLAVRFHPVTLSEVVRWMDGHGQIPRRAVLVTFDDGWSDTYTKAFPVMNRLGVPGAVFLATGFIGTSKRQWADVAYESVAARCGAETAAREIELLKRMPSRSRARMIARILDESPSSGKGSDGVVNLTWPQIEEMAQHGFEFGSHTRTHLILPREPEEDVLREMRASAEDMKNRLGSQPAAFVYPDGQYDERTTGMAREAGYRCAFGCDEGLANRHSPALALPRLSIHDGVSASPGGDFSRAMFLTYLAGTIPWRFRRRVR